MQTVQQFYTSRRYIDLAESDYSEEARSYNPERVQQAEIDVSVSEGTNTPVYQMVMNETVPRLEGVPRDVAAQVVAGSNAGMVNAGAGG